MTKFRKFIVTSLSFLMSAVVCLLYICMYPILKCYDWLTYIKITFSDRQCVEWCIKVDQGEMLQDESTFVRITISCP